MNTASQPQGAEHLTTEKFKSLLTTAKDMPIFVDFYADWCGPCHVAAPMIDQLAEKYQGKVHVVKIDVDQEGELAGEYGVMSIPTFIVFKNGKIISNKTGFSGSINGFVDMIEAALKTA